MIFYLIGNLKTLTLNFCFVGKIVVRKLEKMTLEKILFSNSQTKMGGLDCALGAPPRDRLNFENLSTLAVAIVENPRNKRIFDSH